MTQLEQLLDEVLNENLSMFSISKPSGPVSADTGGTLRIRLRPLRSSDRLLFQAEEYTKTQVFHKNFTREELDAFITQHAGTTFKNTVERTETEEITLLANKKGKTSTRNQKRSFSCPLFIPLKRKRSKWYRARFFNASNPAKHTTSTK